MRVIILAAGRGQRLGLSSKSGPKCMTPLCGRLWLDWQLDALQAGGATEIVLVTGYADALIPDRRLITRRVHHLDWAQTGPGASLYRALCQLDIADELVVAYADCLWHPEWIVQLRAARESIAISIDSDWLSLWSERFADPLTDAESLKLATFDTQSGRQQLVEIGARARAVEAIEGQFMGLLRFAGGGCSSLREALAELSPAILESLDMTALLSRLIDQGECIGAVTGAGSWIELDHATDLALYERRAKQSEWSHDWRRSPRFGASRELAQAGTG